MKRIAVYAGSFDPITYGHVDIIERAGRIFDRVIVAVAHNTEKKPLFTVSERVVMLKKAARHMSNIEIDDFTGLAVDYVLKKKANVLIRGIRMLSDFEYEFQMALTNRKINDSVETIFLMPHESYSYLSSTLIKEAALLGADLKSFVPDFIEKELKKKLRKR
ncbi:MAG: pantetheine-phosphate adenylyltransferase [Candidatus Omnitrophica bacterium]|nr:pantetheine-phosphate adenylyltransferase [Candidatus Omnitrophota bacterium]MBU4487650.1 pantetheine-phosphate adenylyltransferase [Candidatus Omnitrophota bacterium]MCG2705419.1 pantetheine-phosphate adenylyltransferase [Candidatus Omnitrophota bacterium]